MVQQIIVVCIGVAVAAYVVYYVVRMVRGKASSCPGGCCGCRRAAHGCGEARKNKSFQENIKKKA